MLLVHLGDFVDMTSLSLYRIGKSFEGQRYVKILSCYDWYGLLQPLKDYNQKAIKIKTI